MKSSCVVLNYVFKTHEQGHTKAGYDISSAVGGLYSARRRQNCEVVKGENDSGLPSEVLLVVPLRVWLASAALTSEKRTEVRRTCQAGVLVNSQG